MALNNIDSYADEWFWAPEVYSINEQFIMYYSADEHICAAISNSPIGSFVQQEQCPIVAQNGIDNSLFIDDDDKAYIFWAKLNSGNEIWSAQLNDDYITIKPRTEQFCIKASQNEERVWASVNEGSFIVKHNNIYYMVYSANSYESQQYGIVYATATALFGDWKNTTKILFYSVQKIYTE